MRALAQALQDHELIVLRVIGEWWELDLTGMDKAAAVKALAERLAQVDLQQESLYLPPEEAEALGDLVAQGGRLPVAAFSRAHGEVRQMGPGRLEREEPWYDPVSAAEALWYRGLIYRGFDETSEGLLEFYFVPPELLGQLTSSAPLAEPVPAYEAASMGFPPAPPPPAYQTAVTDAVDDLTTLLALALQTALQPDKLNALLLNPNQDRRSLLLTLAQEMGMVRRSDGRIRPTRAAVAWLQKSREAQLRDLVDAWTSSEWNDLCHTPGLRCEGEGWRNDPLLARTALLDVLPRRADWYDLADVAARLKETDPDFQRPDGNYDTWYVRDVAEGIYLAGFAAWEGVEGRLLRFLVQGPLFWLGMVETAEPSLFRLTPRALEWLADRPPVQDEVRVPLVVQPDGNLVVPYNADRYQRFQAARIGEPQPVTSGQPFTYRLTPRSLAGAQEQGISPERIVTFLAEAGSRPVPKSVQRAITRWAANGVEGKLEAVVALRVRDEAILDTLRNNPKTRDFIGESLGAFAATVRRDEWAAFRAATAELGLLLDCDVD
jgi:hypothetical protein